MLLALDFIERETVHVIWFNARGGVVFKEPLHQATNQLEVCWVAINWGVLLLRFSPEGRRDEEGVGLGF